MTTPLNQGNDRQVAHDETASFPPLTIVDLTLVARSVDQPYKNFAVFDVNSHCIRLAVMEGEFPWHQHPRSDESFLVLEGQLEIDVADGRRFRLRPGEAITIPAGVAHRTRSLARVVNLCFEDRSAYTNTVFVDHPEGSR